MQFLRAWPSCRAVGLSALAVDGMQYGRRTYTRKSYGWLAAAHCRQQLHGLSNAGLVEGQAFGGYIVGAGCVVCVLV